VTLPVLPSAKALDPALVARLRRVMTDGAGVIRSADGLSDTLAQIARIEADRPECAVLRNMTATATLIAAAALARRESRGAHFRSDFPDPAGAAGRRSLMTLADALMIRDTATTRKEPA
jgi:L-aspartate oxidase